MTMSRSPGEVQVSTTPVPTLLPVPVAEGSESPADTVVVVVDRLGPAVVTVVSALDAGEHPWGSLDEPPTARGSGVIVDPRGYIVTNHHVIESSAEVTVIFSDGTRKQATLIGHDYPFSDLAVIKVEGDNYPFAPLGDSDSLRAGETVVAIGSALGDFRNTVTTGVISGVGRNLKVSESLVMEGMIQTDAAINHGNSGGPLANLQGEVIGINTAIIRGGNLSSNVAEGLGFSIPSNTARYVVDELIEKGKVTRPYLGVSTTAVTPQLAAYYDLPVERGVYVLEVLADTPAQRAGIEADDIILRIGNDDIDADNPLINVLARYESGQRVTVGVNRDGETLELELVLGERP
jgi:2-alkenal reductase